MSMYPSLEDMKVDHLVKAQSQAFGAQQAPNAPSGGGPSQQMAPFVTQSGPVYPGLAEFMGMELSEEIIRANMPEYLAGPTAAGQQPQGQRQGQNQVALPYPAATGGMIAPVSSTSPAFAKSQLSHGVRQVILCKDGNGKVGLKVKSVNKGVFVCLVTRGSPAAMGGLRFGDQILQLNGVNVAGFTESKVNDHFKKAGVNNIVLAVRDRPFERTLTLHKDSTGHLGFQFKEGKITAIAVDSSAARNGLLIDHNMLEVNGQNVVGLKDKETTRLIDEAGQIVTITVIPNFLYTHMVKNMSNYLVKKMMDHSIPDL